MFYLAEPKEIGEYLMKLVESKYGIQREFCKDWVIAQGGNNDNEEIKKKENKFISIKKGRRGIQIDDLPIFCQLLDASCEELLSAGKCFKQNGYRLTNYTVAFSKDKKIWEEYINHKDKLILNADEYGNTVLNYAIKFKNLDFIQYLIDNGYIWFDNKKSDNFEYCFGFGAGTNISRREFVANRDFYLIPQLKEIVLRGKLIALAIENKNIKILKELRAREIPDYYNYSFTLNGYKMVYEKFPHIYNKEYFEEIHGYYNQDIVNNISITSNEIIDYFTDVFEIEDKITNYKDGIPRKYEYTYLYISQLLDELIKKKHDFTELALQKAIKYSKKTYLELKELINVNIENEMSIYKKNYDEEYLDSLKRSCIERFFERGDFECDVDLNILRVRNYNYEKPGYKNLVRNLIRINEISEDRRIFFLIEELNDYYKKIINIKEEFITKD